MEAFCGISLPLVTSILGIVIFYLILQIRKVLEDANNKINELPNVEKLKKGLPLTLNTNWKLQGVINGVPVWRNQSITDDSDGGVIACQALIQASAEATVQELIQPRVLSSVQPCIDDISIIPVIHRNHNSADADCKSDTVSAIFTVPCFRTVTDLFLYWRNYCNLKRRWKCSSQDASWVSFSPEYRVFADKFGNWQLYLATEVPSEGKDTPSTISLLTIMISPNTCSQSSLNQLKQDLTSQIVSIREHMDSLYLCRMLQVDKRPRQLSLLNSPEHRTKMSASPRQSRKTSQPPKSPTYEGKEELGYVEAPAEIKDAFTEKSDSNGESVENQEQLWVKQNLLKYKDTLDAALKLLLRVHFANEETPGWTYLGNKKGVEVYRMQGGDEISSSDCFKGTAEVKVPVSYAMQYVTEIEYKKEWDDMFLGGNTIEEIDPVTKVTYMEYKPVWPTIPRDFCSITATRHVKDDFYVVVVKATSHTLCPPVKGKQRAEVIVGGFTLEGVSVDPPLCKVTFVTRADLKGSIPQRLVNKANEKQPMYAGVIRDKLEERFACQDPPHEGDVKIIAAKNHPSLMEKPKEIKTRATENESNSMTQSNGFVNGCLDSDQDNRVDQPMTEMEDPSHSTLKSEIEPPSNAFHTPVHSDASSGTSTPSDPRSTMQDAVKVTSVSRESDGTTEAAHFRQLSEAEVNALFSAEENRWESMSVSSVGSVDPEQFMSSVSTEGSDNMKPLAEQDLRLPRDRFGNLDFKTLANQSAASLLEEVLLASKVEIKNQTEVDINQPDIWTFQGIFRNVVVFRKIHKDCNIHSFLGRGIIEVVPVTVWEAVKNPATRFVYDNMLKKTKVVKVLDDKVKVIHMRHETTACFVRQARDFVVLTGERVEQGRYVLSGTSVSVPECPIDDSCVRGKVLASGWTIEPVLHHGKHCSLVTYLSQIDFGGKFPVRIINHVAKRQPMAIAYLRKYLEEAENRNK